MRGPNAIEPSPGSTPPAQRPHQVGLAGAVGPDQADPLAEVHLVGERQEQVGDREVDQLDDAAGRVAAAQPDPDRLVAHRRRRRTGGDELVPPRLGGVGAAGVAVVLGRPLLHDLHVPVQAPLLVLPALEGVAELLLAASPGLGERGVGAAVHPGAGALDGDHLGRRPAEQRAVVADHQDRDLAGGEALLQPPAGRDVEVVVGLVEQQHVGLGRQQDVEQQPLALAAGEVADAPRRHVLDRRLDRPPDRRRPTTPRARSRPRSPHAVRATA